MADYGLLQVEVRTAKGKGAARQLRMGGKIPAVVYGRGQDNVTLAIDPHSLRTATDPQRDFNTFFQLSIMKDGKEVAKETCIVVDVQMDTLRNIVQHIDFMRVDPTQDVVRNVPVRTTGRAAGVVKGGRIKTFRRTVHIAAKPADIPFEIVVDVTSLDMGQAIRMRDIVIPNARIDESPDAMLALCELAKVAKEEASAEGGAAKPAAAAAAAPAKAAPAKKADKK
jgi:large subunit ribosomal protein L25